jgi:hypothetical protein
MERKVFEETFAPVFSYLAMDLSKFFPKRKVKIKGKEYPEGFLIEVDPPELIKLLKKVHRSNRDSGPIRHCNCTFSDDKINVSGENGMNTSCLMYLVHKTKEYLEGIKNAEILKKQRMAESSPLRFSLLSRIKKKKFLPVYLNLGYNPFSDKFVLETEFKVKKLGKRMNKRKIRVSHRDLKKLIEAYRERLRSIKF